MNNDLRQYLSNIEYISLESKYATDKDENYIQVCHLYDVRTGVIFFECKESNMWDTPEVRFHYGNNYDIPKEIVDDLVEITRDFKEDKTYHIGYVSNYSKSVRILSHRHSDDNIDLIDLFGDLELDYSVNVECLEPENDWVEGIIIFIGSDLNIDDLMFRIDQLVKKAENFGYERIKVITRLR